MGNMMQESSRNPLARRWQNDEYGLMLDIDPNQEEHYFGTYLANDENIDIFIMFAYEKSFSIYDCKYFDFEKMNG